MDPKTAEAIGLLRHQIISPVLMDTKSAQLAYFRQLGQREFDVPGKGPRRFSAVTMKGWLYRYRKYGFIGITPKVRCDAGRFRLLSDENRIKVRELRADHLDISVVKFYDRCLIKNLLGDPPISMGTLRRFLRLEGLYQTRTATPRKRFEMRYFGELWTCDFMHGPHVLEDPQGKRRRKSILLAIIDDHSRMIVGSHFGFVETTQLVESVFKDALLGFGVPDRLYCDNGAAFSSQYLARVCAHLNIGLVHSKPYDSSSRGKIERFFRTVREGFLVEVKEEQHWDIKGLNDAFSRWLRDEYHHSHHHGINTRPIDRYQFSIRDYPRKRIADENLDEFFLVTALRTVNKDSTISLLANIFEVPPQFIGQKVELKYPQDRPNEVYLYKNEIRIQRIHLVDSQLNGRTYKPTPRISDVALHEVNLDYVPNKNPRSDS
jgi:transposase InsO family protein